MAYTCICKRRFAYTCICHACISMPLGMPVCTCYVYTCICYAYRCISMFSVQPVPKARWKCCVEFRTTPSEPIASNWSNTGLMPRWGPKRWGLVVHQLERIRFESEATPSIQHLESWPPDQNHQYTSIYMVYTCIYIVCTHAYRHTCICRGMVYTCICKSPFAYTCIYHVYT